MLQGEPRGAIMDVIVWLRSLGLGHYEAAFRENDIDETVLPGLTHETLKELGVASIGHRVKLLDAIAALHSDAGGKTPSVDTATRSSASSAHPEDRAERRQVTVMFSDLSAQRRTRPAWTLKTCVRSSRLSEVCRRDRGALWRLRRQVHGRRGPDLLRLPPSP